MATIPIVDRPSFPMLDKDGSYICPGIIPYAWADCRVVNGVNNHSYGSAVDRDTFSKPGSRLPANRWILFGALLICAGIGLPVLLGSGDDMGNFLQPLGLARWIPYQLGGFVLVHAANAAIVLFALWRCWLRRKLPNGMRVVFLMASIFVWTVCGAFEASAIPLSHKIAWAMLEYAGVLSTSVSLLVLALEFGPGRNSISKRLSWSLGAATFAIWLLVPTYSWHGLLWTKFVVLSPGVVHYRHGPVYLVVIGYCYLVVLAGGWRFLWTVLGLPRRFRKMGIEILLALCFPLATTLVFNLGFAPPGMDPAPLGFSLTGIALSISILGSRVLSILPVVREVVGDRMREAILVFDSQRRLVDFSPEAYRLMDGHLALGMELDSLDAPWRALKDLVAAGGDAAAVFVVGNDHWYEARSRTYVDGTSSVRGALVILHDVSVREEMERGLPRRQ